MDWLSCFIGCLLGLFLGVGLGMFILGMVKSGQMADVDRMRAFMEMKEQEHGEK